MIIAGPAYRDVAREIAAEVPQHLEVLDTGDEYEQRLATHRPTDPGHSGAASDIAVQMYTSGTTGLPKGVLTTQRNLAAAYLSADVWAFDSRSVSLTPLPMFHIGGIGWAYLGLVNGATTILVSEFDAVQVLDLLEHERVTNAVFVPTILQMLAAVPGAAERDFSSLRSIAYGASPITTSVLRAALRTFRCPLFGVYGLTETTGGVVQLYPEDHDAEGPRQHLLRSAGKPLPWVEMRIVDPIRGGECGPGDVGEVWLRAPNVMAGYYDRPAETAAALMPDGWLRTGDGGYRDDEGFLFLTDRIKDMIVSGGENIYPVEVEEVLSQHPAWPTSRSSACPTSAGARRSRRWSLSRRTPAWLPTSSWPLHASGSRATSCRARSTSSPTSSQLPRERSSSASCAPVTRRPTRLPLRLRKQEADQLPARVGHIGGEA